MKKIALITGAGSGIGRAVAVTLSANGWAVVLAGRRADRLAETAALCAGESLVHPADVSDPEAITGLFDAVRARFGRLDMLFNNAGMGAPPVPLEDITLEQWQGVVNVNLTAAFLCTQHAFRLMRDQAPRGGRSDEIDFAGRAGL